MRNRPRRESVKMIPTRSKNWPISEKFHNGRSRIVKSITYQSDGISPNSPGATRRLEINKMGATEVQQIESATEVQETRLNHIIAVYVPHNTRDADSIVESVAREFALNFGGASIEEIQGFWIDSADKLVKDIIARVYAFHNSTRAEDIARNIAARVKIELDQESVLIESDGGAILI